MKQFVFTNKLKFFEIEEKGKKRFFIKGAFSSDDLDLVNDICTPNCLTSMVNQIKSGSIKMDFEHEAFRGQTQEETEINKTRQPLAKAIDAKINGNLAEATWELNENYKKLDSKGDVVFSFKTIKEDVENGFLDAFSIAYIPTKVGHKNLNGEEVRLLDDVRLLNVALTGNPINTAAQIRNVFTKSMDAMEEYKTEKKNNPDLADKLEVKSELKKETGSTREKRKIRKEATSEGEEDEDNETETKKYPKKEKKTYEKDGAHAHTENEPLGLHNHPEIEESIRFIHERITDLMNPPEVKEEVEPTGLMNVKSHSQENQIKLKEVKHMENEKEVEKTEVVEKVETEEAKTETESAPLSEVKSMFTELMKEVKSMGSRLATLESKDDEEVEAPEVKANNKAVQTQNKSQGIQAKSAAGLSELR